MRNLSTSKSPPGKVKRTPIRVDLVNALPRDRWRPRLVLLLALSILIHFLSFREIADFGARNAKNSMSSSKPIKIKMITKEEIPDEKLKHMLEAKQDQTEKPKEAEYLGEVNHIAKKETRVDTNKVREKALDPAKTVGKPQKESTPNKVPPSQKLAQTKPPPKAKIGISGSAPSIYSSLMPTADELSKQVDAGYVGYVNDKIALGDAVDINTTEFRFIGYFTLLRKAIEQVWNYPYDAAMRGMQGSVGLVFTINKDGTAGKVSVISSSGYKVLDQAIVDAVGLASPFAPLPASLKKEKLTIKGNFTYTLGNMIGGY